MQRSDISSVANSEFSRETLRLDAAVAVRAITQGIRKDGSKLLPPMGFEHYARMTPADLDAVVAYLRTIPAKE